MNEEMDEERRYTDSHYDDDKDEQRQFMCCTCEEMSFHKNIPGSVWLKKCKCGKGTLLLMPLTMPYPTYRPGTRLTNYQKEVRAILRRWRNGWMHERRQMLKQCEIIPRWDTDDTADSQLESMRLCHSKDMPIKVYSWFHDNYLPQFLEQHGPEANTDKEQYALEVKLIQAGGVMQW